MYKFDFLTMKWVSQVGSDFLPVQDEKKIKQLNKIKAFHVSGSVTTDLSWSELHRMLMSRHNPHSSRLKLDDADKVEYSQDVIDVMFKEPSLKRGRPAKTKDTIKQLVVPVSTNITARRVVGDRVLSVKNANGIVSKTDMPIVKPSSAKEKTMGFLKPASSSHGRFDIPSMAAKLGVSVSDGDQNEIVNDLMRKCRQKLEEDTSTDNSDRDQLQEFMRRINAMSEQI